MLVEPGMQVGDPALTCDRENGLEITGRTVVSLEAGAVYVALEENPRGEEAVRLTGTPAVTEHLGGDACMNLEGLNRVGSEKDLFSICDDICCLFVSFPTYLLSLGLPVLLSSVDCFSDDLDGSSSPFGSSKNIK